eukprot:SAG22_NODE_550_length_9202_cov_30.666484_7_plen_125_part_00
MDASTEQILLVAQQTAAASSVQYRGRSWRCGKARLVAAPGTARGLIPTVVVQSECRPIVQWQLAKLVSLDEAIVWLDQLRLELFFAAQQGGCSQGNLARTHHVAPRGATRGGPRPQHAENRETA